MTVQTVSGTKTKTAIIIGVVVGVLLAGGGAAYAFFGVSSPQRVFKKMLENMATVESVEYAGEITTRYTGTVPGTALLSTSQTQNSQEERVASVRFSGASDWHKGEEERSWFDLSFENEQLESPIALQTRHFPGQFFLRLTQVPEQEIIPLDDFINEWFVFEQAEIEESLGIRLSDFDERVQKLEQEDAVAEETEDRIIAAWHASKPLVMTRESKNILIGAISTNEYRIRLDEERFIAFLQQAKEIDPTLIKENDIEYFEESFAKLQPIEMRLWLGRRDFLPYRMVLQLATEESLDDWASQLTMSLDIVQYNRRVELNRPTEYTSIVEAFQEVMTAREAARDVAPLSEGAFGEWETPTNTEFEWEVLTDTDADGLTDQEEILYGTDAFNADTDGDGYLDGNEVEAGYDPNGPGRLF